MSISLRMTMIRSQCTIPLKKASVRTVMRLAIKAGTKQCAAAAYLTDVSRTYRSRTGERILPSCLTRPAHSSSKRPRFEKISAYSERKVLHVGALLCECALSSCVYDYTKLSMSTFIVNILGWNYRRSRVDPSSQISLPRII